MKKLMMILVTVALLVLVVFPFLSVSASDDVPASEDEVTDSPKPTRRPSTPTPAPTPTPTPTPGLPTPIMRPPITQQPVKYSTIDDLPDLVPGMIGEARSPDRLPVQYRIEGADWIPVYHYYLGENLVMVSSVFNAGTKDTGTGFFENVWYLNDEYLETQIVQISPPDAGQEISLAECFYVPTAPGDYKFTLMLDDTNRISESDESNNYVSAIFSFEDANNLPDLIANFSISGVVQYGAFQPNQPIFITPNVIVNGILSADAYKERWTWGSEVHDYTIPAPQSSQVQIVRNLEAWSWTPPANGNYTLMLEVDPDNEIRESNENNNTASFLITVDDFTGDPGVQIGN